MRKFGKTNGSKVGNSAPGFFEGKIAAPRPRTYAQDEFSQPRAKLSAEDIKILEEEAKKPLDDISELISSITSMHQ